jgi:hypothetical protein
VGEVCLDGGNHYQYVNTWTMDDGAWQLTPLIKETLSIVEADIQQWAIFKR